MSRVDPNGDDAVSITSSSSSLSDEGEYEVSLLVRHDESDPDVPGPDVPGWTNLVRDRIRRCYAYFPSAFSSGRTLSAERLGELNTIWTRHITDASWADRQLRLFEEWAEAEVAAEREALAESDGVRTDMSNLSPEAGADVLDAVAAGTVGLPGWLVDEQFVIAPEFERGPLTAEEESAFDRYLASQDRSASEE